MLAEQAVVAGGGDRQLNATGFKDFEASQMT